MTCYVLHQAWLQSTRDLSLNYLARWMKRKIILDKIFVLNIDFLVMRVWTVWNVDCVDIMTAFDAMICLNVKRSHFMLHPN